MILYVQLEKNESPIQFTTALEAKEYLINNFTSGNIAVASSDEPVDDPLTLDFLNFDTVEGAREEIDKRVSS